MRSMVWLCISMCQCKLIHKCGCLLLTALDRCVPGSGDHEVSIFTQYTTSLRNVTETSEEKEVEEGGKLKQPN